MVPCNFAFNIHATLSVCCENSVIHYKLYGYIHSKCINYASTERKIFYACSIRSGRMLMANLQHAEAIKTTPLLFFNMA